MRLLYGRHVNESIDREPAPLRGTIGTLAPVVLTSNAKLVSNKLRLQRH
jgi:hypothetical protein